MLKRVLTIVSLGLLCELACLRVAAQPSQSPTQPQLELPDDLPPAAAPSAGTTVGGYAELHYNQHLNGPDGEDSAQLDLHRFVLMVAHRFDERVRMYSEIELEHALIGPGGRHGELSVEQAAIEYSVHSMQLNLLAGVLLVPMGIINRGHSPPTFNGVERPAVERIIIPTTWSEGGLGVTGQLGERVRYEFYVMTGLDPRGFRAGSGIGGGRRGVASAASGFPAFVARAEVEPTLGLVCGVSGYWNRAGHNARLGFAVDVLGAAGDVRFHRGPLELRAVLAYFAIGQLSKLAALRDIAGDPLGIDVGRGLLGAYLEVAYDVLHRLDTEHALAVFARAEWLDTSLRPLSERTNQPAQNAWVAGMTYRPIPQLALKLDLVRNRVSATQADLGLNLGLGWMF